MSEIDRTISLVLEPEPEPIHQERYFTPGLQTDDDTPHFLNRPGMVPSSRADGSP